MTHTHDTATPASERDWFDALDPDTRDVLRVSVTMAEDHQPVNHQYRLFLLGRSEQVLRTGDLQAPDDFF